MLLVIDRFEGEFAVCEKADGHMVNLKKKDLPDSAKEGDVLELQDSNVYINEQETDVRRKRIAEKANRLFR